MRVCCVLCVVCVCVCVCGVYVCGVCVWCMCVYVCLERLTKEEEYECDEKKGCTHSPVYGRRGEGCGKKRGGVGQSDSISQSLGNKLRNHTKTSGLTFEFFLPESKVRGFVCGLNPLGTFPPLLLPSSLWTLSRSSLPPQHKMTMFLFLWVSVRKHLCSKE